MAFPQKLSNILVGIFLPVNIYVRLPPSRIPASITRDNKKVNSDMNIIP